MKMDKVANSGNDEFYTPLYAIKPIEKHLKRNSKIWCPFDEEWSAFYQTFKKLGYSVIRTHICEGKNFFTYEPDEYDIIISNPPFSIKDKILERLYELGKPFAVLLPLNSLQGVSRYKFFSQGIQILSFDQRIGFHSKSNMSFTIEGSPFATVYFCRDILPRDLIVEKLNKYDKRLL